MSSSIVFPWRITPIPLLIHSYFYNRDVTNFSFTYRRWHQGHRVLHMAWYWSTVCAIPSVVDCTELNSPGRLVQGNFLKHDCEMTVSEASALNATSFLHKENKFMVRKICTVFSWSREVKFICSSHDIPFKSPNSAVHGWNLFSGYITKKFISICSEIVEYSSHLLH
jgi:hypothetical protein